MAARSAAGTSYAPVGDWRDHAACRPQDGAAHAHEDWWPEGAKLSDRNKDAIATCRRCPVRDTCLDWALDHRQDTGIWGGMTEDQRKAERTVRYNAARNARRREGAR